MSNLMKIKINQNQDLMKTQLIEFIIMYSTFTSKELQSKNVYELKALAKFIKSAVSGFVLAWSKYNL